MSQVASRPQRFAPAGGPGRGPGPGGPGARFMEKPKLKDGRGTILRLLGYLKHVKWQLTAALSALLISTAATLVSLWLARVPAAYLLTWRFGPNNMHWCYAAGWVMGLAILVPYYHLGKWKKGLVQSGAGKAAAS